MDNLLDWHEMDNSKFGSTLDKWDQMFWLKIDPNTNFNII